MKTADLPDDFDHSIVEVFNEMLTGGQTTPLILTLPPEVTANIKAYEIEHALKREELLDAALRTLRGRLDQFVEAMDRRLADQENFAWPVEDPLLCVLIAFAWIHTIRWADKARDTYGLEDKADETEPLDWWETDASRRVSES
jgi:hypothetical protein